MSSNTQRGNTEHEENSKRETEAPTTTKAPQNGRASHTRARTEGIPAQHPERAGEIMLVCKEGDREFLNDRVNVEVILQYSTRIWRRKRQAPHMTRQGVRTGLFFFRNSITSGFEKPGSGMWINDTDSTGSATKEGCVCVRDEWEAQPTYDTHRR